MSYILFFMALYKFQIRLDFLIDETVDAKQMVRDLDSDKRRKVCQMLNEKTIPKHGVCVLAAKMKYEKHEIEEFLKSENPTAAVLQDWEKREESKVQNFIKFLEKMGRNDVIDVLKQT